MCEYYEHKFLLIKIFDKKINDETNKYILMQVKIFIRPSLKLKLVPKLKMNYYRIIIHFNTYIFSLSSFGT